MDHKSAAKKYTYIIKSVTVKMFTLHEYFIINVYVY